ncbi:unnamed protein product [Rotaria socialis]|uniref:G domain-containing protein n=1 Tax=Rotaria socialis TaxID=392032 RepID=A0A821FTB5_9BILA|nr:unnamed protein product [Rotaria socialis]
MAAAIIPFIPMAATAIASMINAMSNNNKAGDSQPLSDENKQLREKLEQKESEAKRANDELIAQTRHLTEKLAKREKEQYERNEALVSQNRNLLDKMEKNEAEQRLTKMELAAQNERLQQQIQEYQTLHQEQIKEMTELLSQLKKKQLNTFEDIEENDKAAKEALIKLARKATPIGMAGNNVALFGITSTGKSTMLNALYGEKVAETGIGETTIQLTSYKTEHFVLWDVPGKNDEVSYMSMQYMSFFKGLTRRIILVGNTLKENSSMMKLLDAVGLDYDIVVNKMDQYEDEKERAVFCNKIKSEVQTLKLKGAEHIFFVSAKFPKQFPDWLDMVNYLTSPRK